MLNWGQSIGHATEVNFTPDILHGECVAMGSILKTQSVCHLGILDEAAIPRIIECFEAYGLPLPLENATLI